MFSFSNAACCEVTIWVLGIKADIFEKLLGFQSHLTDPSVVGGGLWERFSYLIPA